eukprot:5647251-Pyramimonas_sp.AAC.1
MHSWVHPDERMNVLEIRRMRRRCVAITQNVVSAAVAQSAAVLQRNNRRSLLRRPQKTSGSDFLETLETLETLIATLATLVTASALLEHKQRRICYGPDGDLVLRLSMCGVEWTEYLKFLSQIRTILILLTSGIVGFKVTRCMCKF